ncbi:MAG: hypothetical protein M1818_001926 [Claussenomyces sp. TS43310]|nr:MAG: hypothetical protein M1818_001926 [Claussenomyces sp. TS43310]
MPIAFDTIESKLRRGEFENLTTLESYIKRMVSNAKEYNEQGSEIHSDAERIRKATSNFMVKHNPAYKNPGYVAFPTPLPPDKPEPKTMSEETQGDTDAEGNVGMDAPRVSTPMVIKRRPGRPPKNPLHPSHPSQLLLAAQRATDGVQAGSNSKLGLTAYTGLTFQQAQDKLISDMLSYKKHPDDEFPTFEPFVSLPPRTLRDYYQVIQHPVSLKGLLKRVRGVHARNEMTGASDFRNWKSLVDEVECIWLNAWHYNEDSSEISQLARELQVAFKKILANEYLANGSSQAYFQKNITEAKKAVPEPPQVPQPKLKLKMAVSEPAPKITLRMGGRTSPIHSPAPSTHTNGSAGPAEVQNGVSSHKNPFSAQLGSIPSFGALDRARSMSGSVNSSSPGPGLVKHEESLRPSPVFPSSVSPYNPNAPPLLQHSTSSSHINGNSMLPPAGVAPAASSPYLHSTPGQTGAYGSQPAYQTPNTSFESKWRQPGKDASDAMITNLSLATHPGLNISRHFRMDLPPSATMAQQSITINLPATHYYLQIKPTIAAPLLERQHKLFVTAGTQRLHGMPTIPGQAVDPRHPLFEARLLPGVNRIEVELIAALPKGAQKPANGQDVELEKITVFANLLRS